MMSGPRIINTINKIIAFRGVGPNGLMPQNLKAMVDNFRAQGQRAKAIKALEEVPAERIHCQPFDFAYKELAAHYLEEKEIDKKIETKKLDESKLKIFINVFKRIFLIEPKDTKYKKVYYYLGMYYLAGEDKETACYFFNIAREYYNKEELKAMEGLNLDKVIEALDKNDFSGAEKYLGKVYKYLESMFVEIFEPEPKLELRTVLDKERGRPGISGGRSGQIEAYITEALEAEKAGDEEREVDLLWKALELAEGMAKKPRILELKQKISTAFFLRGKKLFGAEKYDKAIEALRVAIRANKKNTPAKILLTEISKVLLDKAKKHEGRRELEKALECCKKATEARPAHVDAWVYLGYLYRERGNPQKTLDAYQRAVALDKNNISILTALGEVYEKRKDYGKALSIYLNLKKKHLRGFRDDIDIVYIKKKLVDVYHKLEKHERAKQEAEEAKEIVSPKPSTSVKAEKKLGGRLPLTKEEKEEKKREVFNWFQSRVNEGLELRGKGFYGDIPEEVRGIMKDRRIFGTIQQALRKFCQKPRK